MGRRAFLRGTGVSLALPLLDVMLPRRADAVEAVSPMRMVCICTSLGLHAPYFFPKEPGRDYQPTPYLEKLGAWRNDFTVFSGLSHPEQAGADGHSSEQTWLTAARHPGLGGFRNSISLDQLAAERIGLETRYPSLVLGTSGSSQSHTRGGIMIPAETRPSRLFAKLFLDGSPDEIAAQRRRLGEGRSIMDTVGAAARDLSRRVGAGDRERLDEYLTAVREMEQRLAKADAWAQKPRPKVEAPVPQDIADEKDLIGRMRLLFDLIPLALRTDSTRLVTVLVQGRNDVPPVPGVSIDHHNLSHHGQDEAKIAQLKRIEEAKMTAFAGLLGALKAGKEGDRTLLDRTMVLFGSNLGNANAHDTTNLPILLAGGGFRHAGHLAVGGSKENVPLCNLFVQMLQRAGVETDAFGSSTRAGIPGFEAAS